MNACTLFRCDKLKDKPRSSYEWYEYYDFKKILRKEIRKLYVIRYFLLKKAVRIKRNKNFLGFSKKGFKRTKLVNTINTLRDKIIVDLRTLKFNSSNKSNVTTFKKKLRNNKNKTTKDIFTQIREKIDKAPGISKLQMLAKNKAKKHIKIYR